MANQQQQMSISRGLVQRHRQRFEQLIRGHQYESIATYARRVEDISEALFDDGSSHARQLCLVQARTLMDESPDLISFIRTHDDLYRAAVRHGQLTKNLGNSPGADPYTLVAHRRRDIETTLMLDRIMREPGSMSPLPIGTDPHVREEFPVIVSLITDEIVRLGLRLAVIAPPANEDVELENVGPDHDIEDFGADVPRSFAQPTTEEGNVDDRDHTSRCCICLAPYDMAEHQAFLISKCRHVVGRPCFSAWLNGTLLNSNLCPCCRTELGDRRPRRPVGSEDARPEIDAILDRLNTGHRLLEEINGLQRTVHATAHRDDPAPNWMIRAEQAANTGLRDARVRVMIEVGQDRIWRFRRT